MENNNDLYDALVGGSSTKAIVNDWVKSYEADRLEGLLELINFLTSASGCPGQLNVENIEDADGFADVLEELEPLFKNSSQYPLQRGKESQKFKKLLHDFWLKFIQSVKTGILYEEDSYCIETLSSWLGTMSSSTFRPFRHTGTYCALLLQTELAKVCQDLYLQSLRFTKQLNSEKGANDRKKTLKVKVVESQTKSAKIREQVVNLYQVIFMHRYRDVDHIIRQDCIRELGKTIVNCPHVFLESQYIRYLGWMLSDKNHQVRLESLKSFGKLFSESSFIDNLGAACERFKPRIIDMALKEKDSSAKHEAIKVICQLGDSGFLDDDDNSKILPILVQNDEKSRDLIAPYINTIYQEQYHEALRSDTKDEETFEKYGKYKALAKMLVDICNLAKQLFDDIEATDETDFSKDKLCIIAEEGLPIDIQKAKQANRDEIQALFSWINRNKWQPDFLNAVKVAATALYKAISVLSETAMLCQYLIEDFSGSESEFLLSEEEETFLLIVLSVAMEQELDSEIEEENLEISRQLIETVPHLLRKYSSDLCGPNLIKSISVISLTQSINLQAFIDLRMVDEFELLFKQVADLLNKSDNIFFLKELSGTLGGFISARARNGDGENPLEDNANKLMDQVVQKSALALLQDMQQVEDVIANDEIQYSLELFVSLQKKVTVLQHLCFEFDIFQTSYLKNAQMNGKEGSQIIKLVMDYGLKLLQATIEDSISDLVATSLMEQSLKLMFLALAYQIRHLANEQNAGDVDVSGITNDSKKLVNFCENIVANTNEFDVAYPLPLRLVCLEILLDLYQFLNCASGNIFPSLIAKPSKDSQASCVSLIADTIDLLVVEYPTICKDGEIVNTLGIEPALDFQHFIFERVQQVFALMEYEIFDFCFSGPLCQWFGYLQPKTYHWQQFISENRDLVNFEIAGQVLTDLISHHVKNSFGILVKRFENSSGSFESRLDELNSTTESICVMLSSILELSIHLYVTGNSFEDAQEALCIFIADEIKKLVSFLQKSKNDVKSMARPLSEGLCRMIIKTSKLYCEWISSSEKLVEQADLDMSFMPDNDSKWLQTRRTIQPTMKKINASWKNLALVAGQISHLLKICGQEDMITTNDIVEEIASEMIQCGLRPTEDDREWNDYFEFIQAIEKGASSVKRTTKRQSLGSAKKPKKTAGKRQTIGSRLDAIEKLVHSESTSTRSSARLSLRPKRNLSEITDDEDEDEDIPLTPKRNRKEIEYESPIINNQFR